MRVKQGPLTNLGDWAPHQLDCGLTLLSGDLANSVPPTGSTAGGALVSPTPPPGGVLDASTRLPVGLYHSPLEGESQKPSRTAKADAVGGKSRIRTVRQGGRVPNRRETERHPTGVHAGGTPALPGGASSHHSCSPRGHARACRAAARADAAEPSRLVALRGSLFCRSFQVRLDPRIK